MVVIAMVDIVVDMEIAMVVIAMVDIVVDMEIAMVVIAMVDMETAMVIAMVAIATVDMETAMEIAMVAIATVDMEIAMVVMEDMEMVMEAAAIATVPTINTFLLFERIFYNFYILKNYFKNKSNGLLI